MHVGQIITEESPTKETHTVEFLGESFSNTITRRDRNKDTLNALKPH